SGSYSNPTWITALAWSKITGTPTTRAGYGITDAEAVLTFNNGLTRNINTVTNNLITGLAGGQTITGGTAASEVLTLRGTSHATRGSITVADPLNVLTQATGVVAQFKGSTGQSLYVWNDATTTGISANTTLSTAGGFLSFNSSTSTLNAATTIDFKLGGTTTFSMSSSGLVASNKVSYNSAPTIVTTGTDDLVLPHVRWILDQIKTGDVDNVTYTSNTSASAADVGKIVFLDGTSSAVTYSIAPASFNKKRIVIVAKNTTNTVKIFPSTGLINGLAEYQLTAPESITIYSDGTNLWIL
ncbi:MAG TPA: hypothetical protein VEC37_11030, partial [Bacillota bacterium]|nr:hypothetical protein [Bacillota bacterium]